MTPTPRFRALIPLLLVPVVVRADSHGAPAPIPASDDPRIELETLAGEVTVLAPGADLPVDPRERGAHFVRFLSRDEPTLPGGPDVAQVTTASGDRLRGRVVTDRREAGGGEDVVELELAPGIRLAASIDDMRELRFPGRLAALEGATFERPESGDRLYRVRGRGVEPIPGIVSGFTAEGIAFEARVQGERVYPWDEVALLMVEVLDEPLEVEQSEGGTPVVVDVAGGSRIRGSLLSLGPGSCRLRLPLGGVCELPHALVREVGVLDGTWRSLSELEPSDPGPRSPHGDELGMVWPIGRDRTPFGEELRAGGRAWSRGLWVHAPSRLTYGLDGAWKSLRTGVAVDDSVLRLGEGGTVRFRIHVDGELRWESGLVSAGDPPVRAPTIALDGARELVLEVDPTEDLFVADRADWLRPLLVR